MVEFKISKELSIEVENLKSQGEALNGGYKNISADDVSTLETSVSYIKQHKAIKNVFALYKELVLKDAQDLVNMISEVETMDKSIAEKTGVS